MRSLLRISLGVVAAGILFVTALPAAAAAPSLRTEVRRLLEEIEQTRMLLGAAMWEVHDLRNLALSGSGAPETPADLDRESLRLYELLKPLDYAASSLAAAVDLQDPGDLAGDLAFLSAELPPAAAQVLAHYDRVHGERERQAQARLAAETAAGLTLVSLSGRPWADPLRERQRQLGALIGWRTNIEPPPEFRESFWNSLQQLDLRYQLAKGRMLGVDFIVPKDPILRWDWVEPEAGRYDFARLDRLMALAAEHGMRVKLVLPVFANRVPDWLLRENPAAAVRDTKGQVDTTLNGGTFAHDFMGPVKRDGPWYAARAVNLQDPGTRKRFAAYVRAVATHCRRAGYQDRLVTVALELFHAERHWRLPAEADERAFVTAQYRAAAEIVRDAFAPVPVDLEVSEGEAHFVDRDLSAQEWRSVGLTALAGVPGVTSETPFFEDLMRAGALAGTTGRARNRDGAGPFFYQSCEYGFGCMLSVNFFTSLLRDGLWADHWFGPEGPLRWGYFPQVMTWNDRQLQWSGITNGWLALRQAHLLGPTLANTRVTPADVILVLPSSTLGRSGFQTHRELVGWGWALTALKIPYDVLPEAELQRGLPERARLVILPQAAVLPPAAGQALRAHVKRGGLLLASLVPGTDGSAPSPLADVTGCDLLRRAEKPAFLTQTGVKGTWWQTTVNRGLHSGKYTPVPPPDTGYPRQREGRRTENDQPYQALAPAAGAQVAARFLSGEPALVEHAFGAGRVLTSGYPIGNELLFADWTSIAFGKIYNGWAREEQMLGMLRELQARLVRLGYRPAQSVPEGWRHRLQGFEAAVSSLSYPKGPPATAPAYGQTKTYLDPRPDHRLAEEHDDLDYAMELTWRDRPGVATRYLAVGNRESAYAGERAVVQFWVMPHVVRIRIEDPRIRHVVDVAAGVPLLLQRDERGVSFRAALPPAEGRVYAVSSTDTVELFAAAQLPGVGFAEVARAVRQIAARPAPANAPVLWRSPAEVRAWLATQRGQPLAICYGDDAYRPAAEKLRDALRAATGSDATLTADDGTFTLSGGDAFQMVYQPSAAQILIGNAWSNNAIATLDCTWPYNTPQAPAALSGRCTATYAWPGGERGVGLLTRARDFRRPDHSSWGLGYGNTEGYAPRLVDEAAAPHLRRRLLLLASTPAGAQALAEMLARDVLPEKP